MKINEIFKMRFMKRMKNENTENLKRERKSSFIKEKKEQKLLVMADAVVNGCF